MALDNLLPALPKVITTDEIILDAPMPKAPLAANENIPKGVEVAIHQHVNSNMLEGVPISANENMPQEIQFTIAVLQNVSKVVVNDSVALAYLPFSLLLVSVVVLDEIFNLGEVFLIHHLIQQLFS